MSIDHGSLVVARLTSVVLLALLSCSSDPPAPLSAGECREDRDCPGRLMCRNEERPGEIATCGCKSDAMCPLDLTCDSDIVPAEDWRDEWGGWLGNCRCRGTPGECGPLLCDPDVWQCRCDDDGQCAQADPGIGCRCERGLCVRNRGDDVVLCDLRRTAEEPDPPDAGVSDGGQPADPADSGAGGEQ